jgi:hypothetical protein
MLRSTMSSIVDLHKFQAKGREHEFGVNLLVMDA